MSQNKPIPPQQRHLEKARKEGRVKPLSLLLSGFHRALVIIFFLFYGAECWVNVRMLLEYGLVSGVESMSLFAAFSSTLAGGFLPMLSAALLVLFIGIMLRGAKVVTQNQGLQAVSPTRYLKNLKGHCTDHLLSALVQLPLLILGCMALLSTLCFSAYFFESQERVMVMLIATILIMVAYECGSLLFIWGRAFQQARSFNQSLYMSLHEYREDQKRSEGDPAMKQKILERHRQEHQQMLLEKLQNASVVVFDRQEG